MRWHSPSSGLMGNMHRTGMPRTPPAVMRGRAASFPVRSIQFTFGKPGTDGTFSDNFVSSMARLARVVAVDVAHHVTQRGNRREYILASDSERMVYLDLLRQAVQLYPLSLIGYCLMSNHVHLIIIPHESDALALAFKRAHGQYASYWNAAHASSGHAWQGRFFSCPLDPVHLWKTGDRRDVF